MTSFPIKRGSEFEPIIHMLDQHIENAAQRRRSINTAFDGVIEALDALERGLAP